MWDKRCADIAKIYEAAGSSLTVDVKWETADPDGKNRFRGLADAAIKAMREPTEAMIYAAREAWDRGPGTSLDNKDADARHCWQTMIDEALRDQ